MALDSGHGLGEIIVHPIDGILLVLFDGGAFEDGDPLHEPAENFPQVCIVGDHLGNDVGGPGQSLFCRIDALFGVYIIFCQHSGLGKILSLPVELHCQRLQAFFLCHGSAGAALGPVGTVEVLQLRQGDGGIQGGGNFLRQLFLGLDGFADLLPALGEIPEILQPVGQSAERGVVHGSVEFLAVPGNKRNGVAFIQKGHHIFNIFGALFQLLCKLRDQFVHRFSSVSGAIISYFREIEKPGLKKSSPSGILKREGWI